MILSFVIYFLILPLEIFNIYIVFSDDNKFDLGENLVDADHNLFGALRYFDDKDNIETIYVQGFNEGEESLAYMNRLNKAAGGHHLNK